MYTVQVHFGEGFGSTQTCYAPRTMFVVGVSHLTNRSDEAANRKNHKIENLEKEDTNC